MKFTLKQPKCRDKEHWHMWFAWYPVRLESYTEKIEYVWWKKLYRYRNTGFKSHSMNMYMPAHWVYSIEKPHNAWGEYCTRERNNHGIPPNNE